MSENKKGDRLNVKRDLLMKPFIVFALVPYDQRFQGTTSEIPGYKYRLPIPIWYYKHQLMLVFRQRRTPAWPPHGTYVNLGSGESLAPTFGLDRHPWRLRQVRGSLTFGSPPIHLFSMLPPDRSTTISTLYSSYHPTKS